MSEEEEMLAEFGSKALRAPKAGCFDRLLALHLVMSVTGDPLNAIIHSCRAALALPDKAINTLEIDKQKVKEILTVAMCLVHARLEKEGGYEYYSIRWTFERQGAEGFKRYIQPWLQDSIPAFYEPREWSLYPEKREDFETWSDDAKFYFACKRLTPDSYQGLVSAFCAFAFPFVEQLNQKVSTQISPVTYQEILKTFQSKAKASREESE